MTFCYGKLRGKIVEVFGSQSEFAKAMGFSNRTLSLKMNNKIDWRQEEIYCAMELFGIPDGQVCEYFFTQKVKR